MRIIRLIGLCVVVIGIILNIGMWWAIWDLFNTIISQFIIRGSEFPSDAYFPFPYYLQWAGEGIPLTAWSYLFDVCAAMSIFTSVMFILIGAYLVLR